MPLPVVREVVGCSISWFARGSAFFVRQPTSRNMKYLTQFAILIPLIFMTGCAILEENSHRQSVIYSGSQDEVDAEATKAAKSDIARGRPRICYCAGGFANVNRPIGIPQESISLVQDLPKIQLPSFGCLITPEVSRGMRYGMIYNTEILRYLQEHKQ